MKILQINTLSKLKSTGRTTFEMHEWFLKNGYQSKVVTSVLSRNEVNYGQIIIGNKIEMKIHAFLSRLTGLQGYFSTGDGNFMKDCSSIERVDMSGMLIGGGTYSSLARAFMDCTSLRQLILCGGDPYNITSMCNGCTSLEYLDMRNLNVAGANIYSNAFDGVPANCEIIVKDTSNLNWVKAQRSDFTNVHIA